MSSEWTEIAFSELIAQAVLEIGDGFRAQNSELGGDGPIFLRAGHVRDTHIDFDGVDRFDRTLEPRVASKMSRPGDVILTTKGNSTGRTAFVNAAMPPFVYSPHLSYWRSRNFKLLAPTFLRYWARSRQCLAQVEALASSTDMAPYLSLVDQRRLRVVLPSAREQVAIGSLLGALDDKIELNRRMSRTLEEMAQAIFKSWFIDFDGHTDLVPSELGPIPRGWRVGTLGEAAEPARDVVDPSSLTPETPYIGLADMPLGSITLSGWGAAADAESGKLAFRRGDFLFGKLRPYFKKVGIAPVDGICSSDMAVVRPRTKEWYSWTLGALTQQPLIDYCSGVSSGTRMPRVGWADMAKYPMVLPTSRALAKLETVAHPMIERIVRGTHESRTLASLRDLLLPKLISGELRIPDAEKAVSEVL